MTKKRKEEIRDKVEWEGGLADYIINYGPDLIDLRDKTFKTLVDDFTIAFKKLETFLGYND